MFYFIFEVFIGRGRMENFAIHLFAGMVVVHFFTETFGGGTRSLVSNRGLIVKLAMPRELFPVASMLVALWHTLPMMVILGVACVLLGWEPDPVGVLSALLAFGLIGTLGLALALIFSVANVYFRDFGKVVQTLTQFVTFSVPMIYPFTLVEERFGELSRYYLLNPVAEAVLLFQRGFWVGTTSDPEAIAIEHLPEDLYARGLIMLGGSLVLLVFAQLLFTRLDRRVPERL
jgi:ABC-2 type transport system permease protein